TPESTSTDGLDRLDIFSGDTVMTRSNNPDLGVANRESFRVVQVHSDGGLILAGEDQRHHHITPDYVHDHIHLGYAVTDYGNQGTTVDHGSVLLESSMSGAGVYVGATRGRHDNTIHLVAEDYEDAKAQFITTMTRDRADRGLDQARAELAQQLPKHIMAVPGEVQRYLDRLKANRTKLQRYADYTKPLHDYDQHVAAFRAQHGATLAEAKQAARQASQRAEAAHQQAQHITQQRRAELYQQARQQIGDQLASLHTLEHQARNAGLFDLKGTKAKARQQREALEAEYGHALPRGKHRIKHHHATEDSHWVDRVAVSITNNNLPTDSDVVEAQQQAHQAAGDARQATEHR